jgi:hypothetical protein
VMTVMFSTLLYQALHTLVWIVGLHTRFVQI